MSIQILVTAEVSRVSGKFTDNNDIAERLVEELESADPGEVSGVGPDGDSEYEVTDWTVEDVTPSKPKKGACTLVTNSPEMTALILGQMAGVKAEITTKAGAIAYGVIGDMTASGKGIRFTVGDEVRSLQLRSIVKVEFDA